MAIDTTDTSPTRSDAITAHPDSRSHGSERDRMRSSAAGFALLTLVSRVTGMAREIAAVALFSVSPVMSAFTIAFQIPNLMRAFVADVALNASIVPVFTDLNEQGERERAWRVASTMASLIVLALVPITVLSMVAAPWIIDLATKDSFPEVQLAIDLFRIMVPIVVLMALNGVVVSILNAYDHFSAPAFAPVAWNLVVIGALVFATGLVPKHDRIYVYALGIVAGTIVQLLLPIPWLRGRGGRLGAALSVRDPAVRTILRLMLPVTASLVLINLNLVINISFASHVSTAFAAAGEGPAILDKAFRLYMLPQGIISVAISTVFFPALARYATHGDMHGFRETVQDGLKQLAILLVPMGAMLAVLAEPTVKLIYEHGHFTADRTPLVAAALAAYAGGLAFNGASLLLIRAFFSLKRPRVPLMVGAGGLVLNVVLVSTLSSSNGVTGIAAATSIGNLVVCTVLYQLLRRETGHLNVQATLASLGLAVVASALMATIGLVVWNVVNGALGSTLLAQLASIGSAFAVAGGAYLATMIRFGVVRRSAIASLLRRP